MMHEMYFSKIENINKIIINLYNDELPLHNRIVDFFHSLMDIIYFERATILFFYKASSGLYEKHSSVSINWDHDTVVTYDNHYCHYDDTLPVFDQDTSVIFMSNTFFNPEVRKENLYWKEYLVPNNCIYSLEGNIPIRSTHALKAGFCFYRGAEKNDFTEDDVQIFKLFQPHLSNILKYYGEENSPKENLFGMEDYNCVGIGMLNENYQIIKSNRTFHRLVETETSNGILYKAIQLCKNLNKDPSNRLSSEYKFDEDPIFMEVTKISNDSEESPAKFCCMIYDISHFFTHTLMQAKEKYELSARELEIMREVLKGKSNEEIAKEQFISLPTVKKYLASVYSKMDIKSQKQIYEKLKLI